MVRRCRGGGGAENEGKELGLLVNIPNLTTEQMREVDRAMIQDFHIELIQMMENAGRNLAHLARTRFLGGDPRRKIIAVLAGSGGNGGGALVAARRLHNWGAVIRVFVTKDKTEFTPIPAHQFDILSRMGVSLDSVESLEQGGELDLIIDGVIGYALHGAPRGTAADLIQWANAQSAPVLSLDVPSGIDATTGVAHEPAIHATATLTLALPKEGLRKLGVAESVGELYLADLSVPPELYGGEKLALNVGPIFAQDEIIRIV